MIKSFTLVFFLFSSIAFSTELHLADVISEPENNRIHKFSVEVDDNFDILGLVRRADEFIQKINLGEIIEGTVLLEKDGFNVITLTCSGCDSVHGGEISLKYLYDGLGKKYREFSMELLRDGDNWSLFTKSGAEKINSLKLVSRKFLGRLVGIKKILVNP
jgi:hypothetical protein